MSPGSSVLAHTTPPAENVRNDSNERRPLSSNFEIEMLCNKLSSVGCQKRRTGNGSKHAYPYEQKYKLGLLHTVITLAEIALRG